MKHIILLLTLIFFIGFASATVTTISTNIANNQIYKDLYSYNVSLNISATVSGATIDVSNWEIDLNNHGFPLEINLIKSSVFKKEITLRNLGNSSIPITLSCQDSVGDLCTYITFSDTSFNLSSTNNETLVTLTLNTPSDFLYKEYSFDIIAQDNINISKKESVSANFSLSFIENIYNKMLSSRKILDNFFIPYIVLFLFACLFSGALLYYLILRHVHLGIIATAVLAVIIGAVVTYIL